MLRTSYACAGIVFTPYRGFGSSKRLRVTSGCNLASDPFEIHVGLATCVGNPTPSADTSTFRACRHVGRNFIRGQTLPRSIVGDREDNKVFRSNISDVRDVSNSECSTRSHGLILSVHVRGGDASWNVVVVGIGMTIRPITNVLSVEREGSYALICGDFDGD